MCVGDNFVVEYTFYFEDGVEWDMPMNHRINSYRYFFSDLFTYFLFIYFTRNTNKLMQIDAQIKKAPNSKKSKALTTATHEGLSL